MIEGIQEILLTREEVLVHVRRIGREISRDYAGKNPLLVSVLKGAFVFMADLCRELTIPCTLDFMSVSSYGSGSTTSGRVKIIKDLDTNIENRHVIIVEDILDSGITLSYLLRLFQSRRPASIAIAALFDKPERRKVPVNVDYKGVSIPNKFVVGYGLDYDEKYRNLPDLCVLSPEVYDDSEQSKE